MYVKEVNRSFVVWWWLLCGAVLHEAFVDGFLVGNELISIPMLVYQRLWFFDKLTWESTTIHGKLTWEWIQFGYVSTTIHGIPWCLASSSVRKLHTAPCSGNRNHWYLDRNPAQTRSIVKINKSHVQGTFGDRDFKTQESLVFLKCWRVYWSLEHLVGLLNNKSPFFSETCIFRLNIHLCSFTSTFCPSKIPPK